MLIVRGTKKLRDRVRGATPAGAGDESTTVLGDWFATALLDRASAPIASVLQRHGVPDAVIAAELAAMSEVRLAPTNDRSILGVMNGFGAFAEQRVHSGDEDLEELSLEMSQFIIGPLTKRAGSPDREPAAVLGLGSGARTPSNVMPFPGSCRPEAGPASDPGPTAIGWWNFHLDEFEVDGKRFGTFGV